MSTVANLIDRVLRDYLAQPDDRPLLLVLNGNIDAVAVGYLSRAGTRCVALGRGANANHNKAVALGEGSVTNATDQVQVSARHFELEEMTEPTAPAANRGRLYLKDNGAGKTQLCVRFATGAVQVVATEP